MKDGYHRGSLDPLHLESVAGVLKSRGILLVGVSGHGETTVLPGWDVQCRQILDQGLELYLSSNMARELNEEEARTLSRFRIVQVSCDTHHLRLFRELRRGGDFRMIVFNMGQIRAQALKEGRKPPEFWWNCVLSDRSLETLESFVAYGLAQGVALFNFINLCKREDLMAMAGVRHITELPREALEKVPARFDAVFRMIRAHGASYICDNLLGSVRERLASGERGELPTHATFQKPGTTRDCLDPWLYLKVASDAHVNPCCRGDRPVGTLGRQDLDLVANGASMRGFRAQLLSGDLEEICRNCNIRGWTSTRTLRLKVMALSTFGRCLPALHRLGILMPLLYRLRRKTPN
jgi:hypothetical protein